MSPVAVVSCAAVSAPASSDPHRYTFREREKCIMNYP